MNGIFLTNECIEKSDQFLTRKGLLFIGPQNQSSECYQSTYTSLAIAFNTWRWRCCEVQIFIGRLGFLSIISGIFLDSINEFFPYGLIGRVHAI